MKLVRGRSLAEVLEDLAAGSESAEKQWPLARLLTVFVGICHALAYAHSRNVVHRDLKPANVMIGDFGEVYVMDWGLAKVLVSGGQKPPVTTSRTEGPLSPLAGVVRMGPAVEADLTRDGDVLGTPAYMPPEQAAGRISDVDQRSDVYALGAILYEMLTLESPIDTEGDFMEVLLRAAAGIIVPPEQRTPERAQAGEIPRELSAIALKALAYVPADRYPSVEALRRDVERFQEGRSVSARPDTTREMLWKLVKRNKGASVGIAVALLVLLVSAGALFAAWRTTSDTYDKYRQAHGEKEERTAKAVPALVESARLAIDRHRFDNAMTQVKLALDYDQEYAEARLLRGQLLILEKDFPGAREELERYLVREPTNTTAGRLVELCRQPKLHDEGYLLQLALLMEQLKTPALADELLKEHGRNFASARDHLLELYRKRIEKAWPGLGEKLTVNGAGIFALDFVNHDQVTELSPLEGMPLTRMSLRRCPVRDLTPLKGMPLVKLNISGCHQLTDLTPLRDLPLTDLEVSHCDQVHDLTPLRGLKLTKLDISLSTQILELAPLKDMPLTSLNVQRCHGIRSLAPLQGMPLRALNIMECTVPDLTPLAGLSLTELYLTPRTISRGMDAVRRMKSLNTIAVGFLQNDRFTPEEFWKRYDAGEFNK
jgi:hypothetical protein